MNKHCWSLFAMLYLAGVLVGCGDSGKGVTPVASSDYTDPKQYYGTYVGKRIDQEASATPESIEELIGSSTLTWHDNNSTFTMVHEGVIFGGNVGILGATRDNGEKFKIIQLNVMRIGSLMKTGWGNINIEANKAAGREPSTPEMLEKYQLIMDESVWRFEILDDGFVQLDSGRGPGMYRFTRDDEREPLGVNAGNERANDDGPNIAGSG